MNRLHDERDDEEEILPDVLFDDDGQDEVDEPCKECGDEGNVQLVESRTMTDGNPDPLIPLCGTCRSAHEAFYDAVEEDLEETDADEVDTSQLD